MQKYALSPSLRHLVLALSISAAYSPALQAKPEHAVNAEKNAQISADIKLKQLSDRYWDFFQRVNPEAATLYGEYRLNNKLRDLSEKNLANAAREAQVLLEKIRAIPANKLSQTAQIDQQLLIRTLSDRLTAYQLKTYLMPLEQMSGVQAALPQLLTVTPFETERHFYDYIARLNRVPQLFEQAITLARIGQKQGLIPPRYILEKVVTQCGEIAGPAGEENVFASPLKRFPASFNDKQRIEIRNAMLKAVNEKLRPAYLHLQKFVSNEYAAQGRAEPGIWALKNGEQIYRFAVRTQTTTDLNPEQIHQIGLKEVADLEAQTEALAKTAGYKNSLEFRAAVKADPKLKPVSREQIIQNYEYYTAQMQVKLPELFGVLPKAKLKIAAIPDFLEKDASTNYQQGTADGSRPGQVWVNTYNFANRNMVGNESTAYHEGVPGHHMQISIAQELPGMHPFHRALNDEYNAYVEGWALYSERLGKEVGFFQDPVSDLGRLNGELFRAIRLVVDTGLHAKHWTREQALDYFDKHASIRPEAEVDRYVAWPAQALGYKIGQLKIIELRQHAQAELGDKFDLRSFHDNMLNAGALPLDMLEQHINSWIALQKNK
ncbi:DUF885 domain-containing protein [Undibacterium sp. TJN19]|uniref:DUF885 domain-containing protein n=1 Tax=Undibacterium sp. TJN19 TaxID=3413055 RepID=UPI003BF16C78